MYVSYTRLLMFNPFSNEALQSEQLGLTVRRTGFTMSALTSLTAATTQLPSLLQLRQQRVY